jgi:hypothetical protein
VRRRPRCRRCGAVGKFKCGRRQPPPKSLQSESNNGPYPIGSTKRDLLQVVIEPHVRVEARGTCGRDPHAGVIRRRAICCCICVMAAMMASLVSGFITIAKTGRAFFPLARCLHDDSRNTRLKTHSTLHHASTATSI